MMGYLIFSTLFPYGSHPFFFTNRTLSPYILILHYEPNLSFSSTSNHSNGGSNHYILFILNLSTLR